MNITRNDKNAQLCLIWDALQCYREDCISGQEYDKQWDDICTAMAWITEDVLIPS